MEDKNMFLGIPTYLFASTFDEIIPNIITKDLKKHILLKILMCSSIDAVHKQFNKYCFHYLSNVSRDKINFVYIVIQFDPYKYYSPSEGLNYLNKYF